ncbi:glycosyl transferase family A [Pontibacter akesuensis]|nr:glycosyl transferase family A [Pontibacter akesuensis]
MVPSWLSQHSFHYDDYKTVSRERLEAIKKGLKRLSHPDPVVSIVLPAWNEEQGMLHTLSSLSMLQTRYPTELIVVNNNSTDRTQEILDLLEVRSVIEKEQGVAYARNTGLQISKGKYHLCGDSDTLYPPTWVDAIIPPLEKEGVVCVYGLYSLVPPIDHSAYSFGIYSILSDIDVELRRGEREFINVRGVNFGFKAELGRKVKGFELDKNKIRKMDAKPGTANHVEDGEDGTMALRLLQEGKLQIVRSSGARVWTSPDRALADGGLGRAAYIRIRKRLLGMLKSKLSARKKPALS